MGHVENYAKCGLLGYSIRYFRLSRLLLELTQAKADGSYYKKLMQRPRGTDKVTGLDANFIRQSLIDNGVEWNHTGDAPETNLDHDGLSWKTIFSVGHGVGIIKDKPTWLN